MIIKLEKYYEQEGSNIKEDIRRSIFITIISSERNYKYSIFKFNLILVIR